MIATRSPGRTPPSIERVDQTAQRRFQLQYVTNLEHHTRSTNRTSVKTDNSADTHFIVPSPTTRGDDTDCFDDGVATWPVLWGGRRQGERASMPVDNARAARRTYIGRAPRHSSINLAGVRQASRKVHTFRQCISAHRSQFSIASRPEPRRNFSSDLPDRIQGPSRRVSRGNHQDVSRRGIVDIIRVPSCRR